MLLVGHSVVPLRADYPGETLRDRIIDRIDGAKSTIEVVIYEIADQDIADALVRAEQRGIHVRVIVDEARSRISLAKVDDLVDAGIPVRRIGRAQWELFHDKFILFDKTLAATPSYNRSARSVRSEDPAEGAFTRDRDLLRQFSGDFDYVWNSAGRPAPQQ